MKTTRFLTTLVAFVAALIVFPSYASAQFFNGFGRVANQRFSGKMSISSKVPGTGFRSSPVNSRDAFRFAVREKVEPKLIEVMKAELGKQKSMGFTPYFISLNRPVSLREEMFVGTDGLGFTARYITRGYVAQIGMHTPDLPIIGGLPRGANPKFQVPMDIEMTVDVNTSGTTLAVQLVKLKLFAARPRATNLTGKVLTAANSVSDFLGGPNFLAKAQSKVNGREVAIQFPFQQDLTKLFPAASTRQYSIRPVYVGGDQSLRLDIYKEANDPIVVR